MEKFMKSVQNNNGITLIALVITIVVMLILAGVTINLTLGENGIFTTAQKAVKNYTEAQEKEQAALEEFTEQLQTTIDFENQEQYNKVLNVNKPKILTGMTPIKFTDPTDSEEGKVEKTNANDANWYNYNQKKWANAETEDGSMWVWIPRYAYRINSSTQTCNIVFLIGTTDKYYDENGEIQTAKRATSSNPTPDTTTGYTVHPAFTNESGINYANGGWDKELTGIWVAKFEAGYASGNNTAKVQASEVYYSQASAWIAAIEAGTSSDTTRPARNWLDGEYGVYNSETKQYEWKNGVETAIKYPTFQGTTYAMNYINHNDACNISKTLTGKNNIYGLNAATTDSHLMKNSEWGAVAYLGQSKYGLNETKIYINNASVNNSTKSVYAVTGCCAKTEDVTTQVTTIDAINSRTANVYVWSQKEGQKASSTGTIYGVYDMSGATFERTPGYIVNGHSHLKKFGESISYDKDGELKKTSTKYTTVYPYDNSLDNSGANYALNTSIFGDGIRETSTEGTGTTSWYGDYSGFVWLEEPFFIRGGEWFSIFSRDSIEETGSFAYENTSGASCFDAGFRSVLVAL